MKVQRQDAPCLGSPFMGGETESQRGKGLPQVHFRWSSPRAVPTPCPTYLPISEQGLASVATAALGYTWLGGLEVGSQRERPMMTSTRAIAVKATATKHFFMVLWARRGAGSRVRELRQPGLGHILTSAPVGRSPKSRLRNVPAFPPCLLARARVGQVPLPGALVPALPALPSLQPRRAPARRGPPL